MAQSQSGQAPLTVLQVVPRAAGMGARRSIGGQERLMLESLRYWNYGSVRLVVAYPREGRLWDDFQEASRANPAVELVDFPTPRRRDFGAVPKLYRLIRGRGVGLVHAQGPHGADWWAAVAARLARVPVLVSRAYALADYQLPRLTELRFRWTDRLALGAAAGIVFDSERVRRRAVADGDCDGRKALVIPNGISLERFAAPSGRDPTGARSAPPTFGMVGQLIPVKHWEGFIEAAGRVIREIPDAVALVVGDGPERERLARMVRERGLRDRVVFTGFRPDVADVLREMDVFVLSSLREGLPVAVIEAMAMGKPVVATDVGGVGELVEEERTGFLVPPRDPAALADRIVHLLRDPERRAALGEAARRSAEERFSLRAMVDAYQELYLNGGMARVPFRDGSQGSRGARRS